jgi:hypothetical protein
MFDWASDPRVPGSGDSLLRKLSEMFDFLCANGGSEMTQKIIPNIGFHKVGEAWFGVRPLRPLRQMLTHRPLDWKAPARFARSTMQSLTPAHTPSQGWGIQEGVGDSETHSQSSDTAPSAFRSNAFFRYLQKCPSAQIKVFQVLEDGRHVGRIALSLAHHQLRVAGVWLNDPSPEARCAAYSLALRAAREMDSAFEIVALGSTPDSERAAACVGLKIRNHTPIYWLSRTTNVPPSPFEFQMADNDTIFRS